MSRHVVCMAHMVEQNCMDKRVLLAITDQCAVLNSQRPAHLDIVARTMDAYASPASFSADLAGCEALPLLAADEVTELFVSALGRTGATVVDIVCHALPTAGLICVLILRESHAVLHTWPETGTINIDIFSKTPRLKSLEVITELSQTFGARRMSIHQIARDGYAPRTGASA
jgi:S-adenosylmethionine decarboxylase